MENLHAIAGAWVFRQLIKEAPPKDFDYVKSEIYKATLTILAHEASIIDMIFSHGSIEGITNYDLLLFVRNRIWQCLSNLGIECPETEASPINDWFYSGINNYQFNDFFTAQGREYVREWNEAGFVWESSK